MRMEAPNYCEIFNKYLEVKDGHQAWSFEGFVVEQADEIAQWHHDLEDALRSGAMSAKAVCRKIRDSDYDHERKRSALL